MSPGNRPEHPPVGLRRLMLGASLAFAAAAALAQESRAPLELASFPRTTLQITHLDEHHAARKYAPRIFPGRMTVFLSGETPPGFSLDPERDLDGLEAGDMGRSMAYSEHVG